MTRQRDNRKKRIFRKTPGGKTKKAFLKRHNSMKKCGVCGKKISGTLPAAKEAKASKTEKRPSAQLAGVLCNSCRVVAVEEALKVREGVKKEGEVELRFRKYAGMVLGRIEGGL
jgi:large subunit ribosomal protein L34e